MKEPARLPTDVEKILWGTLYYMVGTVILSILLRIAL